MPEPHSMASPEKPDETVDYRDEPQSSTKLALIFNDSNERIELITEIFKPNWSVYTR